MYSDDAWLIQAAVCSRALACLHVFAAGDTASRFVALFVQDALQSLHSCHELPLTLGQASCCSRKAGVVDG